MKVIKLRFLVMLAALKQNSLALHPLPLSYTLKAKTNIFKRLILLLLEFSYGAVMRYE